MKKLVTFFLVTMVITTFGVSTGFSTSYNVQILEMMVAFGINDNGSVVGINGSGNSYALYSNGNYTEIFLWGNSSIGGVSASSINNANQTAGIYGGEHGFWYNGTDFYELNYPGALYTTSATISNNGLIVGTYRAGDTNSPSYNGFTYTPTGGYNSFHYQSIDGDGVTHESHTTLAGVNNSGAIIGTYYNETDQQWQGFMFDGINYATLVGMNRPLGINDFGQVVGLNNNLGVLYANGVYTPLDFAGVPFDINNKGQIAGWNYQNSGENYGFIASPVPLPPTVLLLGSGLLGLVGWRRFRKN
jgi:hypothetical protein